MARTVHGGFWLILFTAHKCSSVLVSDGCSNFQHVRSPSDNWPVFVSQ